MEKLQVGLIATGGRGAHGFEMHRPEQGIEIVAGCDIAQPALDKFKEKFPDAQTFTDYRDLLKIDSIGAVHGNDKNGLTALLNSASSLNQQSMSGTPVLNIRLDPTRMHKSLKALALGYFENGGLQIQVTCVNRDELLRAKENPEGYPNLVVRI